MDQSIKYAVRKFNNNLLTYLEARPFKIARGKAVPCQESEKTHAVVDVNVIFFEVEVDERKGADWIPSYEVKLLVRKITQRKKTQWVRGEPSLLQVTRL